MIAVRPRILTAPAAAVLLLCGTVQLSAQEPWDVSWKNSTRIESPDSNVELKLGGRIQADFSLPSADETLEREFSFSDGTELRRARLYLEGTLYKRFEFKAQYDFAGGETKAKDIYVGLVGLPGIGGLRVGHFKEPFGLEELTSSKHLPFIERSFTMEAFAPSRNMGFMAHNQAGASDRLSWAVGAFKDVDDFGAALADEWNVTGRVTGLLVASTDDRRLVHLGAAYSRRSPNGNLVRYRARPQAHLAPRLVDTGTIAASGADLLGLELAWLEGPFWLQAERVQASLDAIGDPTLSGYTLQAGWFLTGENRGYKRSSGVLDRVTPKRPWIEGGGPGAWEIALRFSDLDLDDQTVTGGAQDGLALALNWYPTSFTRLMLDYTTTDRDAGGSVDIVLARFQVEF